MRYEELDVDINQPDGPTAYQLNVLDGVVRDGSMIARRAGGITLVMAAGCEDMLAELLSGVDATAPTLNPVQAWQLLLDADQYRLAGNEIRQRMVMGDQILYDHTVAIVR